MTATADARAQLAQQFKAAQAGHVHIEDGDVGLVLFDGCERRRAVARLGDDAQTRLGFDDRAQAAAHNGVIVGNHDAYVRRLIHAAKPD